MVAHSKAYTRRVVNEALHAIGNYHQAIPLSAMFEICQPIGEAVQEDRSQNQLSSITGGIA